MSILQLALPQQQQQEEELELLQEEELAPSEALFVSLFVC